MSCIGKDMIQKYIDGEVTAEERALVDNHSKDCVTCSQQIIHQEQMAEAIKKSIDLLSAEDKEIPTFKHKGLTTAKKHFFSGRTIVYSISAACLLVFFLMICLKENVSVIRKQVTVVHCLGADIDANRPLAEQPIVINIIDVNGKVTEYSEK
jgi:predicted anti-sigma-YlaC factor YlaD